MCLNIIGAGIGGLTIAIALEQLGYNVTIYEQAKSLKPVGAGIILANNAMQVYQKLGLREEIEDAGNPISSIQLTDAHLQPISGVDLVHFEAKYGVRNISIHRGILQKILISKFKGKLLLDHTLTSLNQEESSIRLEFENQNAIVVDNLLGADGIHSTVRSFMTNTGMIRDAGQICWRGLVDYQLPIEYQHQLTEAWGASDRFGFVQLINDKVYWYALKSCDKHTIFDLNELSSLFKTYDPLIKDIITNTSIHSIHTARMEDLKPLSSWHQQRICLLGDAAHATTPNLGQGACQSIEDALCLATCISKYPLTEAFAKFQATRQPKVDYVVNTSWKLGKVSHWSNPTMIKIRNTLMRITPSSISRKQSSRLFKLVTV